MSSQWRSTPTGRSESTDLHVDSRHLQSEDRVDRQARSGVVAASEVGQWPWMSFFSPGAGGVGLLIGSEAGEFSSLGLVVIAGPITKVEILFHGYVGEPQRTEAQRHGRWWDTGDHVPWGEAAYAPWAERHASADSVWSGKRVPLILARARALGSVSSGGAASGWRSAPRVLSPPSRRRVGDQLRTRASAATTPSMMVHRAVVSRPHAVGIPGCGRDRVPRTLSLT